MSQEPQWPAEPPQQPQQPSSQPPAPPQPPSQWNRDEKDEKDEKDRGGEKWRNDPLSAIVWAALFVWAGLVLLADNLGILGTITINGNVFSAWSLIFTGAGIIVLVEVLIRLIVPAYRRSVVGSVIFAGILLSIGLGGTLGWNVVWPLILILAGISILVGAITRR